jgi:hypothetical protein
MNRPKLTTLNNKVAAFARYTRYGEHGAGAPRRQPLKRYLTRRCVSEDRTGAHILTTAQVLDFRGDK